MIIREATLQDLSQLEVLINSAYRGEESKKGWTTEAHLLDGIRIDLSNLEDTLKKSDNWILVLIDSSTHTIEGCVHLRKENQYMYLGMLTVKPTKQGGGLGKMLLKKSEEFSIEKDCSSIYMTVISLRKDLISWYDRHGYKETGETKPFPMTDPRFGIPRVHLEFSVLKKELIRS